MWEEEAVRTEWAHLSAHLPKDRLGPIRTCEAPFTSWTLDLETERRKIHNKVHSRKHMGAIFTSWPALKPLHPKQCSAADHPSCYPHLPCPGHSEGEGGGPLQTTNSTQMPGVTPTTSGHCEHPANPSTTTGACLCKHEGQLDLPRLTPVLVSSPTPAEDPKDQPWAPLSPALDTGCL